MPNGTIQTVYQVNPDVGYPGALAYPEQPFAYENGIAQVPTNGRKPRPGDAVYYDRANNGYAVPTDAATLRAVCGIVGYRQDTVQDSLATTPTGANSDAFLEYEDGDPLRVLVLGSMFVRAGAAMERDQRIVYNVTDFDWDVQADPAAAAITTFDATNVQAAITAAIQSLGSCPIVCVSAKAVAANGIAIARIGYGRVY